MSDAVMVVSFTVARGAADGSPFATGDGVTMAGAGVAAGFAGAGRDVAPRRGVCATTTMNSKAATEVARVSLVKFIRTSFCLKRGLVAFAGALRTIIFEEARFSNCKRDACAPPGHVVSGIVNPGSRVSAPLPAYQSHQQSCRDAAARSAESATRNRFCGVWMAAPGQKLLR